MPLSLKRLPAAFVVLGFLLPVMAERTIPTTRANDAPLTWTHLSTVTGDLPLPSSSRLQPVALILDIDQDGLNDFVIASQREPGAAVVWYRRHATGWTKYLVDNTVLFIEAGGASYDIDADGDLDLVMGGDRSSNQVWWWENPHPNHDPSVGWTRRLIKNSGSPKHHDQMFGDFDSDGQAELVYWNQRGGKLFLAEIPTDPRVTEPWPATVIFSWTDLPEYEGLAQADIDGDGKLDIVGGGHWFKHQAGTIYAPQVIDDQQRFSRAATGQLKPGGRPEVVFGAGDTNGPLKWYEWNGSQWVGRDLLGFPIKHGHSLAIVDMDGDGNLDVFTGEMRLGGGNPSAKIWILLGDGAGNFRTTEVATGIGTHEAKVGDLDGDGDLDILGKPWDWDTPRVDIWLNQRQPMTCQPLDEWRRHVIDASKPWRSIFITSADLNQDGHQDIVTGGWWYRNPSSPGGVWNRLPIGAPLHNMAAVYDFDGDGDADVLGTGGQGSDPNATFAWAQNDGAGNFAVHTNLAPADGDFLQGVAITRWQAGGVLDIALSWHNESKGLQTFTVPADPPNTAWPWQPLAPLSQGEALSADDIDRDGKTDLLLGTQWLRNGGGAPIVWQPFTLHPTSDRPDRNRLVDINQDGRLDALISYEVTQAGKVAWYEQPADATATWAENIIATIVSPLSLDNADMDNDGDWDVVVGEHNLANPANARLLVFENLDGLGRQWREHLVHSGDEHHDGAQVSDIDGDGDLDVISIGWDHPQVLLYENMADCGNVEPTPSPTPSPAPSATPIPPVTPPAPTACGQTGLQALYTFQEGAGVTINDVAGVGDPLLLVIDDGNKVTWLPEGGLAVHTPALIASLGPAAKLMSASQATDALAVEAWVKPASANQSGPARIVTLSQDPYQRNFTLAQGLVAQEVKPLYEIRIRTTGTDDNGRPSLTTTTEPTPPALMHLVYTHDPQGQRKLYVDGVETASDSLSGDFVNWDSNYRLALANELTGDRPWLGEFYRVALYNCAFSAGEVLAYFAAGHQASLNQSPTASFTANPREGSAPLLVTFDGAAAHDADGAIQNFAWTFGDGADGMGVIVNHEYTLSGLYTATLVVSDEQGATASHSLAITVTPPLVIPTISRQPVAATVQEGAPVTLTVAATGTAPLAYQWQRNGIAIPGATSSTYMLPATTLADDGAHFSCVITNAVGSVTSQAAQLTVLKGNAAPLARFNASALTGPAPLTVQFDASSSSDDGAIVMYDWAFGDGGAATGITVSHEYTTVGAYLTTLTVTDNTGITNSTSLALAVGTDPVAPLLLTQPADSTVAVGGSATFTVTAIGAEPLSYQWQRNGITISGATASMYMLPAANPEDHGAIFTCIVINAVGAIISQAARLAVLSPNLPPVARFIAHPPAGGAPLLVLLDAKGSSDADGVIVNYTWTLGDGTTATGQTVSHTYTTLGNYLVTLTLTDDDGATQSTAESILVDSGLVAPTITDHPTDMTVAEGASATFVLTATGTLPHSYQWQRNSVDIAGAASSTYTLSPVTMADQGATFSAVVANAAGSVTSQGAMLTVLPPQPAGSQLLYLPLIIRQH